MSKKTLEELRAGFRTSERSGEVAANNYYPFWLMKNDMKAVIRFLPDRDNNNPRGFLIEKVFHNLVINGQKKKVPCLYSYDKETCPICKLSQEYYKVEDKENGKKYWRKKQYIAQALILEDPLDPNPETGETHVGHVRYIALGFQLYEIIKEAFAGDDLETVPYDFEEGNDFIIKKTEGQGGHSTYVIGSKFKGASRPLSEEELTIVDEDMVVLSTLLAPKPTLESLEAQLQADINGESVEDSFAPPPKSSNDDDGDEDEVSTTSTDSKPSKASPTPKATTSDSSMTDVDAMLKTIRDRKKANK
jgi:hypothetical protein